MVYLHKYLKFYGFVFDLLTNSFITRTPLREIIVIKFFTSSPSLLVQQWWPGRAKDNKSLNGGVSVKPVTSSKPKNKRKFWITKEMSISIVRAALLEIKLKKPWLAARNTAGCFISIQMDHKYPTLNDNSSSLYFIEVWAALPNNTCERWFIGQPSWTSIYKSIVRRETSSIL